MGAAHPGFELNPDQRAPKMKSLMTRYRIDFDPDKIGLRVLLDAARYRFTQEQRKSPWWGRDICLFIYLKALIPSLSQSQRDLAPIGTERKILPYCRFL
jgi:hypothetical protein